MRKSTSKTPPGEKRVSKKKRDAQESETEYGSNSDEDEIGSDVENTPTTSVVGMLFESAKKIETVRTKSGNLKGTFQSILKTVEITIKKVGSELAYRTNEKEPQIEKLKKENMEMKTYIRELEHRINTLEKRTPKERESYKSPNSDSKLIHKSIEESMDRKLESFKKEIIEILAKSSRPEKDIKTYKTSPELIVSEHEDNLNIPAKTKEVQSWAKVVSKKGKTAERKLTSRPEKGHETTKTSMRTNSEKKKIPPTLKNPRGTAAVYIVREEGCVIDMAQIMATAKENINLQDIGIENVRPRSSINGGLILEIPKKGMDANAEILAARMADLLADKKVRVTCPKRTREILITGLDISTKEHEVIEAIKKETDENQSITVGQIKTNTRGIGSIWAKCKEETAYQLLKKGRITIGWTDAKVLEIEKRPLQCFKCWQYGHVRNKCTSSEDRRDWCYKCGYENHPARLCTADKAICRLCQDLGLDFQHRMGSSTCTVMLKAKTSQSNGPKLPEKRKGAKEKVTEILTSNHQVMPNTRNDCSDIDATTREEEPEREKIIN
ncbi:uncharacterized protein LOC108623697 [Ceratina calcarata]|uniref:Uncharacterized protein LOC108623697 n=1 Tax=Ceratina calcarata TaxID=156304 RepID=A0AAJ7IV03_9HYME|nr:uncharacterized protein LOC108623697 [Ceratina calcarata]